MDDDYNSEDEADGPSPPRQRRTEPADGGIPKVVRMMGKLLLEVGDDCREILATTRQVAVGPSRDTLVKEFEETTTRQEALKGRFHRLLLCDRAVEVQD